MGAGSGCAKTVIVMLTTTITFFMAFSTSPTPPQFAESKYPFVLAEGVVEYSFGETLNCQYVIAGNIEYWDADRDDHENQVIMVQTLGSYDDRPAAVVLIGADTRFGENGWSQLLVGNYWYRVWVHDFVLDTPLSEEILVDNLDCKHERTYALVNFRQVRPLD